MQTFVHTRAEFIDGAAGKLFALQYIPRDEVASPVLFVPPFGEEMNRSRLAVSRQARRLAVAGRRVLVPDLYGTGDSHGDFGEATLEGWCRDLEAAAAGLPAAAGKPVLWMLRFGALLGLAALGDQRIEAGRLVLWSPCLKGDVLMTQFLRLRLMSSLIGNEGPRESVSGIKATLEAGESVEVAGYEIRPELYSAISSLDARALFRRVDVPVDWFEVLADEQAAFPPPARALADELATAGLDVHTASVTGPKFWSTVETTVAELLIEGTLRRLSELP